MVTDARFTVAAAGNTMAPALAVLKGLGYDVSRHISSNGTEEFHAHGLQAHLVAEDILQLLGLAALVRERGAQWLPSDPEVEALLRLSGVSDK